jgi:DNA-binding NarL/FixJ family response regulator
VVAGGKKFRIILADDHPIILFALRKLVLAQADFELVGEAATGLQALSLVRATRPDVAIIDVAMPKLNGILLARRIRAEHPDAKVLILTAHEDEAHLKQALAAGAHGFIVKSSAAENLVPAIRATLAGATFIDPLLVRRTGAPEQAQSASGSELSPREKEVLRQIALGHSTKEIANSLAIGVKSVETYRARASEKLGLRSKADIVRFARAEGWLA